MTLSLHTKPQGIWGTILLPITEHDQIDWGALAQELDVLTASGLAGIYANGTAGEFHNQTEAEYEQLVSLVAQKARAAGMPFQIGISNTNPRIALDRLRRLQSIDPSAAQFTLPDWWAPSAPELENFVTGLQAAAGDIPLILYNPPQAKLRLSLAQIAQLRLLAPNLLGAKLPGGDADWYAERRRLLPDFSVFVPIRMWLAWGLAVHCTTGNSVQRRQILRRNWSAASSNSWRNMFCRWSAVTGCRIRRWTK